LIVKEWGLHVFLLQSVGLERRWTEDVPAASVVSNMISCNNYQASET